jgi:hypothetical protein
VLHKNELPPEAEIVIVSPAHIVWSIPALTVGIALTLTTTLSVSESPPTKAVTVYVVVEVGATVIDCVVSPVFHK